MIPTGPGGSTRQLHQTAQLTSAIRLIFCYEKLFYSEATPIIIYENGYVNMFTKDLMSKKNYT